MWEPQCLTTLWASTVSYKGSLTSFYLYRLLTIVKINLGHIVFPTHLPTAGTISFLVGYLMMLVIEEQKGCRTKWP